MSNRRFASTFLTALMFAGPASAQPAPEPTPPTDGGTTPQPPPDSPKPPESTPPATTTPPATPPPPPAAPEVPAPVVAPAPEPKKETKPEPIAVTAKFKASLYGFVELDSIADSTQGFGELAGNSSIARPNTYGGDHPQTQFGVRNSRIGIKLAAPDVGDIKTTAQLEMDFLGNQPPNASEAAFYQNPTFRIRHFNLKMATPYVDVLFGQYWQLFGWQSLFHPMTVEIQGLPGQVYSRAPQIRISKAIKTDGVTLEAALAAARPPQKASATPDGHIGVKLTFDNWKAAHTGGSTGSGIDGGGIGASAVVRNFSVDQFAAAPSSKVNATGWGVSIDALVPIVPVKGKDKGNALTLTGSFVQGAAISDLYSGLNFGLSQPGLPGAMNGVPAYTSNVDNGLVVFTPDGVLHPVDLQSYIVGLQWYLPPSGNVFLSANYSHVHSDNAAMLGDAKKTWDTSDWASGNLMWDVTEAVRLGAEFAWYQQKYADGVQATDYRGQFSAFFLF